MEQAELTRRFDAAQDQLMTLIEEGRQDLDTHAEIWDLHRKIYLLMYYGRKQGYRSLGLQPLPVLAASEYNAKNAIAMTMLINSLKDSEYANEIWTLGETSAETVLATEPKSTFKKKPYTVDVWFDNQQHNAFPYTNWREIIYQTEEGKWQKTEGRVSYSGLYYVDEHGQEVYFLLFAADAPRYGETGEWTVRVDNDVLYPPPTSSSGPQPQYPADQSADAVPRSREGPNKENVASNQSDGEAQVSSASGLRRPREESPETSGKRPRPDSTDGGRRGARRSGGRAEAGPWPSASEVGTRHTEPPRRNLSRLGRLYEEARDPPIILLKGPANSLKCWRRRCRKHSDLYSTASSVFKWIDYDGQPGNRLLVAFKSDTQRSAFLQQVTIPRHCDVTFGNLNSL